MHTRSYEYYEVRVNLGREDELFLSRKDSFQAAEQALRMYNEHRSEQFKDANLYLVRVQVLRAIKADK